MKKLTLNMVIAGRFTFDFVNEITVESSWEMLTDTGKIILPANLKLDKLKLRSLIKPGDPVTIEAGYDGNNTKIFEGFISGIKPTTPIEITCEDQMYSLKQGSIIDAIKLAKLSDLIGKHFKGIDVDYEDTEIGTIQIHKLSQAKILERLRESHGLYSFFRAGKLTIGKIYPDNAVKTAFKFQFNIIDEELEYQRKEDMKLRVTAVSNNPDGTITEIKVGDDEGEEKTLRFYHLGKTALKNAAERELNRLKYDGYHGSFTTFMEPVVFHGQVINLQHPEESDKAGDYRIDKVIYKFGIDGGRQIITLGPKL